MKTHYVRLVFLLLTFAVLAGCREASAGAPDKKEIAPATMMAPGPSIYPLDVALLDQNGAAIGADIFRGQRVVISMFFGACPAACPLLVTHIKRLEASLTAEERANLRVLLVSFDAERDTPAALTDLASAHKVDAARWRFASATDQQARVLGNALGISFRKIEGGMFAHDSVITVLDEQGRIVAHTDELSGEMTALRSAAGAR